MSSKLFVIGLLLTMCIWATSGLVDYNDPEVYAHIEALVRQAQICVTKTQPTPTDVRNYFNKKSSMSAQGECFIACMYEKFGIIVNGVVNRKRFLYLLTLVNGNSSKLIEKVNSVSQLCMDFIKDTKHRCQLAYMYNDCLNSNLENFSFPADLTEEIVRKMPYRSLINNSDTVGRTLQYEHKEKLLKNIKSFY